MIIATIIGVRPQFVKAAVLSPILRKEHTEILIHTGQHYDDNMSAVFFRELGLPEPDYKLKACSDGNKTVEDKVERMTGNLISVLQKEQVDAVLLYGDTSSTLAGALAADRIKIPAVHVEAGERNGLVNNPEEQIRKRVDQISSLLLCSTKQAMENLRAEGLGDRARYMGNLMEVSFLKNVGKPWNSNLLSLTEPSGKVISIPHNFYLLTCHRQENANDTNLTEILLAMEKANYPVIYPVHPRNKDRVLKIYYENKLKNIILTEPAGYFDSIHLIKNAAMVVTDSGGMLQEAHFAQTPYVFVMDIDRVPENTRFDVSRLAKPDRKMILDKLKQKQIFTKQNELSAVGGGQVLDWFERNVLSVMREFEEKIVSENPADA